VSSFGKNRSKALRWSAFPENFMGVTSIGCRDTKTGAAAPAGWAKRMDFMR